ncbi:olfactomedin-4-like [Leptodactylus fuscus]
MKTIILLWLCLEIFQAQAAILGPGDSPQKEKVMSGIMDDREICHCSLPIQDFLFPAERLEFLETANLNLSLRFEKEIDKIQDYQQKLEIYIEDIRNLTSRVEHCDMESITDNPDFKMLKLEISELESLVIQLKSSLTGSNNKVKSLYMEVENISFMVNQLERHDKNNILKVRRDIAAIQKRLDECRHDQSHFQEQFDTCEHGGILNISKPQIVQISWKGISHKTGGWGKESFFGSPKELYWVLSSDIYSVFNSARLYHTYDDLRQYKSFKDQSISDTNKIDRKSLLYGATGYSYVASKYEHVDLEGDEYGLWRRTKTGEEQYLKIPFEKVNGKVNIQSLSYNANDRKLYMYNEGFEVIYNIQFKPQPKRKS